MSIISVFSSAIISVFSSEMNTLCTFAKDLKEIKMKVDMF